MRKAAFSFQECTAALTSRFQASGRLFNKIIPKDVLGTYSIVLFTQTPLLTISLTISYRRINPT